VVPGRAGAFAGRHDDAPGKALDHAADTPDHAPAAAPRFRWLLDLPHGVQAAVAMALLVGGFGLQFAVTNPLMATRVFHLGGRRPAS